MAYTLDEEDEDKKAQAVGGMPVGASAQSSGGARLAAGGGRAANGAGGGPSSNFISFDKYMAANQEGADKYAKSTAAKLSGGAQKVNEGLAGARNTFNAGVAAGKPTFGSPNAQPFAPAQPLTPKTNPLEQMSGTSMGATPTGSGGKGGPPGLPVKNVATQGLTTRPGDGTSSPDAGTSPTVSMNGEPGTITPEEALRRSTQKYNGPDALSEGAGWADLLSKAGDASGRINATGSRSETGGLRGDDGLEALLREEQDGSYTKGQSRYDAGLVGAAGRTRFDDLRREYGDLTGGMKSADAQSRTLANTARQDVAASAAAAGNQLHRYETEEARKKKAIDDQKAAWDAERQASIDKAAGLARLDKYQGSHHPEQWLSDALEANNPISWILKLTGNKTIEDTLSNVAEPWVNENLGTDLNSTHVDYNTPYLREVFPSLSQAEIRALERMGGNDQKEWLKNRYDQMQKK